MVKREQGHGRLQTRHARGEIGGDGADGHGHVGGRVAGDELGPPPAARSSRRPRMPSGEVVAPTARIEYEPAKPAARCTAGTPTGADRCGPPGQLPDHPGAAAIRPVLRPDLTIEYPTRSGRQLTPPGDRREPHRPARLHLAPRTRRPATRLRRRRPAAHPTQGGRRRFVTSTSTATTAPAWPHAPNRVDSPGGRPDRRPTRPESPDDLPRRPGR